MHKFLYKLFISLGILLYFPYSTIATNPITDVSYTSSLSHLNGAHPYVLKFISAGTPVILTVDSPNNNLETIKSIDLNGATGASIIVSPNGSLALGSIYNQSLSSNNSNAKMNINVGSNGTLTLTGDNEWAALLGSNPPALTSNSFYYDTNSSEFLITNALGVLITAFDQDIIGEYLSAQLYGGNMPQSITSTYIGPYNIYNGINSIVLGDNSNLIINTTLSSSGNSSAFSYGGPSNNSPTILHNEFIFPNNFNNTKLTIITSI